MAAVDAASANNSVVLSSAAQLGALAAGVLLLVAGQRLLPLISAACGALAGWALARSLSMTFVPEWSLLAAGLVGATGGALVGAAALRLMLAAIVGTGGALIFAVGALILVESGFVPLSAPGAESALDGNTESTVVDLPSQSRALRLAGASWARRSVSSGVSAQTTWTEATTAWDATEPTLHTYLLACTVAGGGICLAAALIFHRQACAAFSAALGAIITLGAGLPLLQTLSGGALPLPQRVAAWLLLGIALACGGWAIQSVSHHRVQARKSQER